MLNIETPSFEMTQEIAYVFRVIDIFLRDAKARQAY
jgi:hypothetical protein